MATEGKLKRCQLALIEVACQVCFACVRDWHRGRRWAPWEKGQLRRGWVKKKGSRRRKTKRLALAQLTAFTNRRAGCLYRFIKTHEIRTHTRTHTANRHTHTLDTHTGHTGSVTRGREGKQKKKTAQTKRRKWPSCHYMCMCVPQCVFVCVCLYASVYFSNLD